MTDAPVTGAPTPSNATTILDTILADLQAESDQLDSTLAALPRAVWDCPTPAAGWAVRDQVTHLAFFDDATILALTDQAGFIAQRAELIALGDQFPDVVAERHRGLSAGDALQWLRRSRAELLAACSRADPSTRLPWYGPDMGLASSATGRLMETWAHGQDIRDTIDLATPETPRLRQISDLGVRTFAFNFTLRGLPVPVNAVRVELTGPSGELWTWGPADSADIVRGRALDFCLVVTQRRNAADTGLTISGPTATAWIAIAQAFAGRATDPRPAISVGRSA